MPSIGSMTSFRTPDELLRYLDVKVLASIPSGAERAS